MPVAGHDQGPLWLASCLELMGLQLWNESFPLLHCYYVPAWSLDVWPPSSRASPNLHVIPSPEMIGTSEEHRPEGEPLWLLGLCHGARGVCIQNAIKGGECGFQHVTLAKCIQSGRLEAQEPRLGSSHSRGEQQGQMATLPLKVWCWSMSTSLQLCALTWQVPAIIFQLNTTNQTTNVYPRLAFLHVTWPVLYRVK
jgi:hypothetical protein